MTAFIAANLSISALNILLVIVIFGLMAARIPPPDVNPFAAISVFIGIDVAIWLGVYGYVAGSL